MVHPKINRSEASEFGTRRGGMTRHNASPCLLKMHVCEWHAQLCAAMHSGILLQEGKADSDGNSLFVLGSLADLQQGTFDVTYLSLFFSFFFCDPFSVNWILAWSLQRNGFSDGWSTWKNCRKESKKSCSTLLLMYMSVAFKKKFKKKLFQLCGQAVHE